MLITLITYSEMVFLAGCLEPLTHLPIRLAQLSRWYILLALAILSAPHYFITLYRTRYRAIVRWAEAQPRKTRVAQTTIAFAFVSLPPIVFFLFVAIGVVHRP